MQVPKLVFLFSCFAKPRHFCLCNYYVRIKTVSLYLRIFVYGFGLYLCLLVY